jgi:hypothetical protein
MLLKTPPNLGQMPFSRRPAKRPDLAKKRETVSTPL